MKNIITILALTFSFSALATLPDSIKCSSKATSDAVKEFTIKDITTMEPDSSIYDASFLNLSVDAGTLEMSFSNQCDNWYSVSVKTYDLRDLIAGKVKSIKGMMKYSDVPLSEAHNSEEAMEEEISITCRLN